jgi:trk system potassium uptake protein TrkH
VLDTPNDFSTFGQVVILMLIQVGGLNIMVLSTFAAILLGRGLGLKGERALGELLDLQAVRSAYRLIVFIVVATLVVEGLGAVALAAAFFGHGHSLGQAAWGGLFHSVSAFCNAGFALQSDSLVEFSGDPLVLLTMATLITLGGLGFAVLAFAWLRVSGMKRIGLAVQVKVVLASSLVLVLVGAVVFGTVEWSRSLEGMDVVDRVVNTVFQSVTARTAGFNSVPFDALHPASILMMMILMFIGASPGGTGGGIKTTTFAVLLSVIPAVARGRSHVVLFGRRLTLETVFRSAVIAVVGALLVLAGALLLLVSQEGSLDGLFFEAVSAFGTVGLSLGVTSSLNGFGKIVVIGVMLAGRIGPLALALLLGRSAESRVEYPEARLMVG